MAALPLSPAAFYASSSLSASSPRRSSPFPLKLAVLPSSTLAPSSTWQCGSLNLHQGLSSSSIVSVKRKMMTHATDNDASRPSSGDAGKESSGSLEDLPLESKVQLRLEQQAKMKLAKKIRMRRKRLVRKRQLRKKGRWPPSKMKKNKNV
ncbi:plastid-specific 50S ribosomal protein 5 [Wolffia australiana]